MGTAYLAIEKLSVSYGGKPVLKDLSLTLQRGEILCVVGESGSGKSTLLRAVLGLTPELCIESGHILLEGQNLLHLSIAARRALYGRRMAMVFQSPGASFNPIRSYQSQLAATLKSHGLYDKASFSQRIKDVFRALGLEDSERILKSCPYEMSGGMNQRIAIAAALLLEPGLLLADEPTSALDVMAARQTVDELLALKYQHQVAELVVTHNIGIAAHMADNIAVMQHGRVVEQGPAAQLLRAPQHPYSRKLMDAVPKLSRQKTCHPGEEVSFESYSGCGEAI